MGLSKFVSFDCATCKMGKSKTLPFSVSASNSIQCFDLVHSDVWGIAPHLSHAHYKYFVTFIDDYSRFAWVYILHSKADVFNVFKMFLAYVEINFPLALKFYVLIWEVNMCLQSFKIFYNKKE